jgi:hypothetical protein
VVEELDVAVLERSDLGFDESVEPADEVPEIVRKAVEMLGPGSRLR